MSDAQVIVVGAGIVGVSAVRNARARGLAVLHVAAGARPASRAASAIAKPSYLPKEQRPALAATIADYGDAVTVHGAWTSGYMRPDRAPQWDKRCWLINPDTPLDLAVPDVAGYVQEAQNGRVWLADGTILSAPTVILATGADPRMSPTGGKVTWGVTYTGHKSLLVQPDQLRLHQWAPYKTISAGPVGPGCRVGSSSGLTPEAATERGEKLLDVAYASGLITTPHGFTPLLGGRYQYPDTIVHLRPGVWWVGGHHRNGYALGPADAARTVARALLEEK